jgi:hypothetical protein
MKTLGNIFGLPIYTSEHLPKEYENRQKRTHRRSRINKKWRKKYGFVSIPIEKAYFINPEYLKLGLIGFIILDGRLLVRLKRL